MSFASRRKAGAIRGLRIRAALESYAPRELLFPASLGALIKASLTGKVQTAPLPLESIVTAPGTLLARSLVLTVALTPLDDWQWQKDDCFTFLLDHFKVKTLDGYGLARKDEAIRAAGACLRYARETQRAAAEHVTDLVYFEPQDHLVLDSVTVRNLELVESLAGGSWSLVVASDRRNGDRHGRATAARVVVATVREAR